MRGAYIEYLAKLLILWLDPGDVDQLNLPYALPQELKRQIEVLSFPTDNRVPEWADALYLLYRSQNPGPSLGPGWGGRIVRLTEEELQQNIEAEVKHNIRWVEKHLRKLQQDGTVEVNNDKAAWKTKPQQVTEELVLPNPSSRPEAYGLL